MKLMIDPALGRHPKTRKLAHLIGGSRGDAIDLLFELWGWALEDGLRRIHKIEDLPTVGRIRKADIPYLPDVLEIDGRNAADSIKALHDSGFIDERGGDYFVHDFLDHQGSLVERRIKDRARKRKNADIPEEVQGNSDGVPQEFPASPPLPSHTSPALTEPTLPAADAAEEVSDYETDGDQGGEMATRIRCAAGWIKTVLGCPENVERIADEIGALLRRVPDLTPEQVSKRASEKKDQWAGRNSWDFIKGEWPVVRAPKSTEAAFPADEDSGKRNYSGPPKRSKEHEAQMEKYRRDHEEKVRKNNEAAGKGASS